MYCKHCPPEDHWGTGTSTNFRGHLRTKHGISVVEDLSELKAGMLESFDALYAQAKAEGRTKELDKRFLREVLDQDAINKALAWFIVTRNLAYSVVETVEFHTFCMALNPAAHEFLTTAHSTIPKLINDIWTSSQDLVRTKLQSALTDIHLSLDIWTSPNQLLLLGICAHFIDHSSQERKKAVLALRPVAGHSGSDQFAVLLPVLEEYGIVRKVGCIMADNASTNDTLCREIGSYMEDTLGVMWDPLARRLRCTGHIINLAVQAYLFKDQIDEDELSSYEDSKDEKIDDSETSRRRKKFRLLGPLGRLHNVVVHIRASPQRTLQFKEEAGRMVPLDNSTRWNSWYQMLAVALDEKVKRAINVYISAHWGDLEDDSLNSAHWIRLRTIEKFLKSFYTATLETEGDDATLDNVLITMDTLVKIFELNMVCSLF